MNYIDIIGSIYNLEMTFAPMLRNALNENIQASSVDLRLKAVYARVAKRASLDAMPATWPTGAFCGATVWVPSR